MFFNKTDRVYSLNVCLKDAHIVGLLLVPPSNQLGSKLSYFLHANERDSQVDF